MDESLGIDNRRSARIATALTALLMLLVTACQGTSTRQASDVAENRAEGQYVIEMKRSEGAEALLRNSLSEWQPEAVKRLETERLLYLVQLARDPGPETIRKRLASRAGVVTVQPNYRYQGTGDAASGTLGE